MADKLGARKFQIPTEIWDKMTPAERWAANQEFLDQAILRGDSIRLSTDASQLKNLTGSFGQEIEYMKSKGYQVSPDGTRLILP